jgi:flagellum-specific ATP synthase
MNIIATHKKAEDIINIGAYVTGSNPGIDYAIKMVDKVNAFLRQNIDEQIDFELAKKQLLELFKE